MDTLTKIIIFIVAVAIIVLAAFYYFRAPAATPSQSITTVLYSCNSGKTITATYYQGAMKPPPSADFPPTPTGSVAVVFDDGRTMTLPQTISADGARYANKDDSFVFWNKGNGVTVLENGVEKTYAGCIAIAPETEGLPQAYSNSTNEFSIRLPAGYAIDDSYKYQELGPGKDISGIKFTIATSTATSTNLASDTYLSIEKVPLVSASIGECTASLFLDEKVATSTITDGDTTYSVASSTGAGAGNRYEETVYALSGTSPCLAVRYFIHYGVLENYPKGTVHAFDKAALLSQFDAIRRTLIVAQ